MQGTLAEEDLVPALHNAIREDKIFPVSLASGLGNIERRPPLDFIVDFTPAPSEHDWVRGEVDFRQRRSRQARKRPMLNRFRYMFSKPFPIHLPDAFPISKFFPGC